MSTHGQREQRSLLTDDDIFEQYARRLKATLEALDKGAIARLARALYACWGGGNQVFLCGNGGSAGNALHLANDYLYGMAPHGVGLRVHALPANAAILTCLANDVGYDAVFATQLQTYAQPGDWVGVLSGSGNSPNVVAALETARALRLNTFALLGFAGGRCQALADIVVHFAIDDMQVAEDMQLIVGHMLMRWLQEALREPVAAVAEEGV
ncbi:SIS domain-containing protein [Burkholderia diffusa]|uniref:SIS domain-containing protein n=1 Tax=Burkholderia diffusa TaxID=488732 RepID=UPI000755D98E|nr:SIS domain-containing protein [Burkholderia diffusa]KVN06951.1 phosphoheptose isomerase [Burkholderia diffusa]